MSEDAVVHAVNSLERKEIVERNYAEKRISKINLARGELQRKKSKVEYFSIKAETDQNGEEKEERIEEDNISSLSDHELIELIKDPNYPDKDSIVILLENRGYRVKFEEGRFRVYKRH